MVRRIQLDGVHDLAVKFSDGRLGTESTGSRRSKKKPARVPRRRMGSDTAGPRG